MVNFYEARLKPQANGSMAAELKKQDKDEAALALLESSDVEDEDDDNEN